MAFNISYIYQAIDRFTPIANKVSRAAGRVNNKIKLGTAAATSNMNAMDKMTSSMAKFAAIAAIAFTLAQPIKQAIAFESAMADIAKVVDFKTPEGLDILSKKILTLSRTVPLAATELSAIIAAGGQFGILEDKLIPFANTVAKISVAFDIAAGEAGSAVAKLSNIFQIPIEKFDEFADAINEVSNNTTALADELVRSLTNKGAAAGQMMGMTANETLGLAAALLQTGVRAERVGSVMDSMSRRLTDVSVVGEQFAARFTEKPTETMITLFKAIRKLEPLAKSQALKEIFGEFSGRIGLLIKNMDEGLIPTLKMATDRMGFLGSVTEEYTKRAATTDNQLTLLGNKFREIGIKIGTALLPALKAVASVLGVVATAISAFITVTGPLVPMLFAAATALLALKAAAILGTAAMWAINLAMAANPFVLIVAGVVALIAGILWLIDTFDILNVAFGAVMTFVSESFKVLQSLAEVFMDIGSAIGSLLGFGDKTIKIKAQADLISLDSSGLGTLSGGQRSRGFNGPAPANDIFGGPQESKASVDVTITAPQGTVKDIQSRSSGNTKLNVGQNFGNR